VTDVLIRGLDPATLAALKERAAANKRSLQAELRAILEDTAEVERKREARRLAFEEADRIRAMTAANGRPKFDSTEFIRRDRDSGYGRLYWPYDDLV